MAIENLPQLPRDLVEALIAAVDSPALERSAARRFPIFDPSPIDPHKLRRAVEQIYAVNGLVCPENVFYCGNPISPVFAMSILHSTGHPFGCFRMPYNIPQRGFAVLLNRMRRRLHDQYETVSRLIHNPGVPLEHMETALKFGRVLHADADYVRYKGLEFLFGRNTTERFRAEVVCLARYIVHKASNDRLNIATISAFDEAQWMQWEYNILSRFYHDKIYTPFLSCYHPNYFERPGDVLTDVCIYRRYREEYPEFRELEAFFSSVMEFYRSGGWLLIPFKDAAFVMLKPRSLSYDEAGRPHNLAGPAVVFQDGVPMYFHNGWPVPEEFVLNPEQLTFSRIYCEPNVEVRRLMIARKGLGNLLREARHDLLAADYERHNPNPRKLYRVALKEDEPLCILHVIDPAKTRLGQPADVFLRVPPTMETCARAVTWTFGFEKTEQYCPVMEE